MPRRHVHPARLLVLTAAAVLAGACSSSSSYDAVDLDGVEDGPCAAVAATLTEVDEQLRGLADEDVTPEQAAERFVGVQDELAEAQVDGEVQPAVTDLVTALGFFRVSVDSGMEDSDEAGRVRTSLGALADACRTG